MEDLTTIVGIMQMWLLVALCELLDDPGELEPEVSDIRWRLFLVGEDDRPAAPVTGLADLVWEDDPVDAGVRPVRQTEARAAAATAGSCQSMNEQELTELFRKLGADDPEGWARSQIGEGIPQLLRYLFLRQAWTKILRPDDRDWMAEICGGDSEEEEIGPAIEAVLATGARVQDLTTVVRIMQWILLFGFCVLLDGGPVWRVDGRYMGLRELAGVRWLLFQIDENDTPLVSIECLHESALSMDPTGREMRPSSPA